MEKMMQLHLFFFGAPHGEKDGTSLVIDRKKTLALLVYLAMTDRPQSRDHLATLLWPEHSQSAARANLRREISRLSQIVGKEWLRSEHDLLSLHPDFQPWIDIHQFNARITAARTHEEAQPGHAADGSCPTCLVELEAAVELYVGDFLEGFQLPDSSPFDEWQLFQTESLRHDLASALRQLAEWQTNLGRYDQAIALTRRWVNLDPLHEPAHRQLMRLYAWVGQPSRALRQYQECSRLLMEELGTKPDAVTEELYHSILARQNLPPENHVHRTVREEPIAKGGFGEGNRTHDQVKGQEIHFCTSKDGVRIAYASSGEGPLLVKAANWLSHLEYDWDSLVWQHWIQGISRYHRLIRYDERGCGLSDWQVKDFSFEAWVSDLEAVVEAAGLDRFSLLGISQGGPIAIAYTVRHPEKVNKLVLYGTYARGRLTRNPTPQQLAEREVMQRLIQIGWGQENHYFRQVFAAQFLPEGTSDQIRAFTDLQRITTSPENAARIVGGFDSLDVQALTSQVPVPTLVLHARGDLRIPFEEGRRVASLIPNARFVPLDSQNHILLESEPAWGKFIETVKNFLLETKEHN
jgi:DNA-binding SARP family transcriptional activator/pimeloyl-ACP methyl ester carboxylesterase